METIHRHSRSLEGLLSRTLPSNSFAELDRAFQIALQHNGLEEIDFSRSTGQSYNPRPARIAQIVLSDAGLSNKNVVVASLLFSPHSELTIGDITKDFSPEIVAIFEQYQKTLAELAPCKSEPCVAAKIIISAAWLDRMRHIHLAVGDETNKLWLTAYEETDQYIELIAEISNPLALLLQAWKSRFSRKIKPKK